MKDLDSPKALSDLDTIFHTRFKNALIELEEKVRVGQKTGEGIIPFLGPTKIGKRHVVRELRAGLNEGPLVADDFFVDRSFISASIPGRVSDTSVRQALLKALDVRTFSTSLKGEDLKARLSNALSRSPVGLIVLYNSHNLLAYPSRFTPHCAADFIRSIGEVTTAPIVVVGLPRFQKLLESNPELRDRALGTVTLRPYRWSDLDDRDAFVGTVIVAFQQIADAGYSTDFDELEMSARLYGISGGRIGMLPRIFKAAVLAATSPILTVDDFRRAAVQATQGPIPAEKFFAESLPPEELLSQAFMSVVHEADLPVDIDNAYDFAAKYGTA